jgi:hypothetical protein
MKRIEIEDYAHGYVVRRFTDQCKKCTEKHWVLDEVPREYHLNLPNNDVKDEIIKSIKEWLSY